MGIQGLLPFLKKLHTPVNIAQFQGQTVAIDAYCWLHKGAFSCADKLALGEPTDQYVYFCMKYVEYMLKHGLKPILVFDGCHLPSKKGVEKARRERREIYKKKAAVFLREGKRAEARECLQRCIDVTPQMALNLMNACHHRGVDCIVAPYEADAQLAYLNKAGIAQIIVTEDSDLLLFGCEKIIFKMDFNGNGLLVEKNRLNEALEIQNGFYSFDKFRYACILSGCDYLPSLHGIGLVKAVKVFRSARQTDIKQLLKKLPAYIKLRDDIPSDYIDGFIKADNTFLYQLAFDPLKRKLVPLNPYPPEMDSSELTYAGPLPDDRAYQIALGNIDINSGQKIGDFDPDNFQPNKCRKNKSEHLYMLSMWDKNYRPMPKIGLKEIQPAERPVLKGKEKTVETKIVKRPREIEDFKDVKSDTELGSLYDELSPAAKRLKSENIHDKSETNDDPLSDEDSSFASELSDIKAPSPETKSTLSPDQKKQLSAADIGEVVMKIEENKENIHLNPRRNKFAVSSLVKRKFNLNASKTDVTVRSRFFAKSEDTSDIKSEKVDKNKEMTAECIMKTADYSDVHNKSGANESPSENLTTDINSINLSISTSKKTENNHHCSSTESPKHSPSSAFSWDKFKYGQSKTSAKSTHNTTHSSASKQFKPVISSHRKSSDFFTPFMKSGSGAKIENTSLTSTQSESTKMDSEENISEFLSSSGKSVTNTFSSNTLVTEFDTIETKASSQKSDTTLSALTSSLLNSSGESVIDYESFSQRSNLESIDSDFMSSQDIIDLTDIDEDEQITLKKNTHLSNCEKKICRVSGLSRPSSKQTQNKSCLENQKSIKDMFSKFALKRQREKLQATSLI